jgi:hypothetical protein
MMQTIQFVKSLRELVSKLKAQEIVNFLDGLVKAPPAVAQTVPPSSINEGQKAKFSELLFESRVGFNSLLQNANTAKLIGALQIGALYDPANLGRLVSLYHGAPNNQHIKNNAESFPLFYSFYGLLWWLLIFEKTCSKLLDEEKVGTVPADDGILELQVMDYDGTGIEAQRLRDVLSELIQIHTDLARALGLDDAHLNIRFADSGSDVIIAIQALKPVIDTLRGLLSEFWNMVKYKDLEDFDKKIDSLSKGLTFVGALRDQVSKKSITQEDADVLRVRVISEMTKIVGNGGTLASDDETVEVVDRRKLLVEKRGIKLLGAGTPDHAQKPPDEL